MAHKNDVIFTEQALNEFIQLIRQNPEMVYKVRAATDEEIAKHNEVHPTLAEGRIPGKGITIIQANGDKFSVAVGSDVKAPNFLDIKNNNKISNGTVTFIVDESYITIPVKGIVNQLTDFTTEDTSIPQSAAVKAYVKNYTEDYVDKIINKLGQGTGSLGYGFIPGKYNVANVNLSSEQKATLNNNLQDIEIDELTGVYTRQSGVTFIENTTTIKYPEKLFELIQNKEEELLQQQNTHNEASDNISEATNTINNAKDELASFINSVIAAKEQTLLKAKEDLTSIESLISNLLTNLNLSSNVSLSDVEDEISNIKGELIKLEIYEKYTGITLDSALERQSNYLEESDEFKLLQRYIELEQLYIYMVLQQGDTIEILNEDLRILKEECLIFLEQERNNELKNSIDKVSDVNELKEDTNTYIELYDTQMAIIDLNTEKLIPVSELEQIEQKLNLILDTYLLIHIGAIKTWEVVDRLYSDTLSDLRASKVYGAVFNDYAEYRNTVIANPGHVVIENGDGSLSLATKRLQLGANIVSDTYGFAIGKTDDAKTPIAVCGRVLAYPLEERELFTPGAAVCSGPNGTISLMTREEIREWPDAIVGYVSEIPTYEYWGTDNIKVDGRIWIKVK